MTDPSVLAAEARVRAAAEAAVKVVQRKEKAAAAHRLRTYGLTLEQWNELRTAQGNLCGICGRYGKLSVDHDHVTGIVRGLLCYTCNRFVLGRQRDAKLLLAAAAYLEHPPSELTDSTHLHTVPPKKRRRAKALQAPRPPE